MIMKKIFAAAVAVSFLAAPALAQSGSDTEKNGHHYQGGPKIEVPHHMGKKETVGVASRTQSSIGHHYQGGPNTPVPHSAGDKQ